MQCASLRHPRSQYLLFPVFDDHSPLKELVSIKTRLLLRGAQSCMRLNTTISLPQISLPDDLLYKADLSATHIVPNFLSAESHPRPAKHSGRDQPRHQTQPRTPLFKSRYPWVPHNKGMTTDALRQLAFSVCFSLSQPYIQQIYSK